MPPKNQEKGGSDDGNDMELHISSKDQMKHICRILGTPKTNDKSFITDNTAIDYMNMICEKKHSNKLHSMFPKTNPKILSLIKSMLEFNPHFRTTAQEALANPIFDSIR